MLRWLIGGVLGILTGAGVVVSLEFQARYGWDRDTSLIAVVYAWVFVGSVAFLMRREAGRRILLGATYALALFSTALVWAAWRNPEVFGSPWWFAVGIPPCALIWAGLRRPSVRSAMRKGG